MIITYIPAWLKVAVQVDNVIVGVMFTDTWEWLAYDISQALTKEESDTLQTMLHCRFPRYFGYQTPRL